MITRRFIIFVVVLAAILIIVSKLLDPMMGIFIVSILVCLLLNIINKDKKVKEDTHEEA